jgi:hypothetical protein
MLGADLDRAGGCDRPRAVPAKRARTEAARRVSKYAHGGNAPRSLRRVTVAIARRSLALQSSRSRDRGRIDVASGSPERQGSHDTRQLHAMTPGLVGQTIDRAGGDKQDATRACRCQDPSG